MLWNWVEQVIERLLELAAGKVTQCSTRHAANGPNPPDDAPTVTHSSAPHADNAKPAHTR